MRSFSLFSFGCGIGARLFLFLACAAVALAQHGLPKLDYHPKVAPASQEAEQAIKKFSIPQGFKVDLVAAEPHLANPVAFTFDEKGRIYVVETFRLHAGVTDIRGIMNWLDEDLACRTPEDRLAMMRRHLGPKFADYVKDSDRVRLLVDTNADGRIDMSTVFAEGFTNALDGLAAGVLARNGKVWLANLPNLWLLEDKNGDGVADTRQSLQYGYGVRVGFLGHDLHGLTFGPDGKIYFSIGDRGTAVRQNGKLIGPPDTGAVFRSNPDGTDLEVFAYGLRNPQELAFDAHGDLFTGDNNSDSGDRARWVYVVEGGDSGWRIGYQFLEGEYSRGPWNAEKLWYPQHEDQAAYIVPPIQNIADGPSGVAYYPGTGLPAKYRDHFFLVDFRGASAQSGIRSFSLKPKGASFELVDSDRFVWGSLATDAAFGPDGGLYFSDWVEGWGMTGKGRIYRAHDAQADADPAVAEVKKLLAEGMTKRASNDLARLLSHPDQRVRQAAQFELAARGKSVVSLLSKASRPGSGSAATSAAGDPIARLHAIWALGQIASRSRTHADILPSEILLHVAHALDDPDEHVRAQAAKVLGDARFRPAGQRLIAMLSDTSPVPRVQAAIALGKAGIREANEPLASMLRANADVDPVLRHAGSFALASIGDMDFLMTAAADNSQSVRMAALLAMRRLQRSEIALFLADKDPLLILEAARAIHDEPVYGAEQALAELAAKPELLAKCRERLSKSPNLYNALTRRVLAANLRHGVEENARALAAYANTAGQPDTMRALALHLLGEWPRPSGRDSVHGIWRPIADTRTDRLPGIALEPLFSSLVADGAISVRIAAVRTAGKLSLVSAQKTLSELVRDTKQLGEVRAESLAALAEMRVPDLATSIAAALGDADSRVRQAGLRLADKLPTSEAARVLTDVLERGNLREKQTAFASLANLRGTDADPVVAAWMEKLLAGTVPPDLQLDVLLAAEQRAGLTSLPALQALLAKYTNSFPQSDDLAPYRVALHGGQADRGSEIFHDRSDVACLRCHKVQGTGGEVGPDLTGVGGRQPREYFLESILFPNKQIAAGFESVNVTMKNDDDFSGVVKGETDKDLTLMTSDGTLLTLRKADIASRRKGLSAMPDGLGAALSKSDLRDLVEWLSSLK